MSAPDARIRLMFALQLPQLVASVAAPRPGAQCARATHGFEKKCSLGVPLATIWADMGYSPEMITTMQDEFAKESATAAAAQAASFGVDVPTA